MKGEGVEGEKVIKYVTERERKEIVHLLKDLREKKLKPT